MLREVSRCDMILGMRLHSLIYTANQRVCRYSEFPMIRKSITFEAAGREPAGSSESLTQMR